MRYERTTDIVDALETRHLELVGDTRKLYSGRRPKPKDEPRLVQYARRLLVALVIATFALTAIALAMDTLSPGVRP